MNKDFEARLAVNNEALTQERKKHSKEARELMLQIPEGTQKIEEGAYAARADISRVVIPEGVVEIGDEAFIFCDQLVSITLPSTLKRIGNSAFQECVNLGEIHFPEGLEEIGMAAFCHCFSLEVHGLSKAVKLGELAFHRVPGLS